VQIIYLPSTRAIIPTTRAIIPLNWTKHLLRELFCDNNAEDLVKVFERIPKNIYVFNYFVSGQTIS
jgi:hypothetical protein